jgi:ATP-dependent Clp protease protease subunit
MMRYDAFQANQAEFLEKTRTIFLYGEINAAVAYDVGLRLKYLDYVDPTKPITIEINSPGGEVSSGLAIVDTINCIESPVKIVVCGMAASMAALIAASGTKGMRYALPHSTVMIHQPLGGLGFSQASDIEIYAKNILLTKRTLNGILAEACGKKLEEVERDTDRDYYMTAEEAKAYGLIDEIVMPKRKG